MGENRITARGTEMLAGCCVHAGALYTLCPGECDGESGVKLGAL